MPYSIDRLEMRARNRSIAPMTAAFIAAAPYAVPQDVWFWREARPLVFEFLPIGGYIQV